MNRLQVELDVEGIERLCDKATSGNVSHIVGTIKSYCRMIKEELDVPDWTHYKAQASIAAMNGMLSNKWWMDSIEEEAKKSLGKEDFSEILADYSVLYADALIEELKK